MTTPAPPPPNSRWAGVDAARGLAIVGMIAAHTIPRPGGLGAEEYLVDGRPSLLFALVAGVSLGLVTGADAPPRGRRRSELRLRIVIRALALLAAGALLWLLPHGIAIILDYYGVMFLLLVPLLFLGRAWLAGVGVAVLAAAPALRDAVVRAGAPQTEPLATATDYLLTGWYPALLWVPVLVAGLLAARSGLQRPRVRAALVAGGATASVAGYGAAALIDGLAPATRESLGLGEGAAAAHSGTVAELLGSGGLAAAVLGLLLVVLDPVDRAGAPRSAVRAVALGLEPLRALGRVALTVYVGHALVLAALSPLGGAGRFEGMLGWGILVVLVVAGVAVGLACEALGRRGPLEAALTALSTLPERRGRVPD
ncbi:heparan-alpha-glucosaminide N-acetyltransferase domain-containing protein [Microcella alkalica]|uniref:heparan-alpha-glucosaminide N-acetyltransferase domain-containing protein n=1 Tax=Microcella alkalica TaxID=355930 RepID=UPI00145F3496|nr:heparan-alpha-glucosaminide N-acetyltransferase domain-containing protein [Microcella alkalica]